MTWRAIPTVFQPSHGVADRAGGVRYCHKKAPLSIQCTRNAASRGDIQLLEWLYRSDPISFNPLTAAIAATSKGHLECLKWCFEKYQARERFCYWDSNCVVNEAVAKNQFKILKYAWSLPSII